MKFIPEGVVRAISEKGLLASEHAPKALFVGGVIGMVGTTVLACRATLKLESVLDDIENDKLVAHTAKADVEKPDYQGTATYPDAEYARDLQTISIRGLGKVAKLYAPAVILGGVSIAALTKSHNLLQDRNLALTAAYTALDAAYSRYRERVIDRYGEEADRELRYDSEEVEILDDETGKLTKTTAILGAPGAAYSRFFASWSSDMWSPDPDIRMLFLSTQQNHANEKLKTRGHIFLNEVYTMLGLSHTEAGAIVGWRWNKGSGDDFVDFGIFDGRSEVINDFFRGLEDELLLDFNVDGVIYNRLDESPEVP